MRLIKANDLDLTRFQFDYDLTMSIFFMNADSTIYGRYGSRRSREDATGTMTVAGLARSMESVLVLHRRYPDNKGYLAGKQAKTTKYKTPRDYPLLRGQFKESLDYQGEVSKSCVHCHQVRDGARQIYRAAGQPIPDALLFPNPEPGVIGIRMDPQQRATIAAIAKGSSAEKSGFRAGDEILVLDEQAIVSQADLQWVLHQAASNDKLPALVKREAKLVPLELTLPEGWRRNSDISWRATSWPLRRMGTGGILFQPATPQQRQSVGLADDKLALVVKHLGLHGPHGAAKRAGFRKGDMVVSFNGMTGAMSTSQLLAYAAQNTKPGQKIPVAVMRAGKRVELNLPMQP